MAAVDTEGFYDLEFNQTDQPEATHLMDFVHEFEAAFERTHLTISSLALLTKLAKFGDPRLADETPYRPLFVDFYGNLLIVLGDFDPPVLYVIDLPEEDVRSKALEHLCHKTVPKLWPEVYADQFLPKKVVSIEKRLEHLILAFREEQTALEKLKQDELDFYARYARLADLGDHALHQLVMESFEEVFGFEVLNLDSGLQADEAKTLDILLQLDGSQFVVEVSSSRRGARKKDLEDIDRHVPKVVAKYGPAQAKVFIFNGFIRSSPEDRSLERTFSSDVIREAEVRGICLMATSQLLESIEAKRNEEIIGEQLASAMQKPGLFSLSALD